VPANLVGVETRLAVPHHPELHPVFHLQLQLQHLVLPHAGHRQWQLPKSQLQCFPRRKIFSHAPLGTSSTAHERKQSSLQQTPFHFSLQLQQGVLDHATVVEVIAWRVGQFGSPFGTDISGPARKTPNRQVVELLERLFGGFWLARPV
jgi:hypothetical protein